MLLGIIDSIEPGMRITQLGRTGLEIVQQRMKPAGIHIGIVFAIPRTVEEPVRIAAFMQPMADEMGDRILARGGDVRVAQPIPGSVEEPFHRPREGRLPGVVVGNSHGLGLPEQACEQALA